MDQDHETRMAQWVARMRKLREMDDIEQAHGKADDILCEVLNYLGCDQLVMEYERIEKWYA